MSIINRIKLAEYFNELGFKVGAEIGVAKGYYSEILCQSIPGLKLYCIDSWSAYPTYDHDTEKHENNYTIAQKTLGKYNCELIKKFSMEAVKDLEKRAREVKIYTIGELKEIIILLKNELLLLGKS